MKDPPPAFSRLYQSALRAHLCQKSRPDTGLVGEIGDHARADGLPMLELARMHDRSQVDAALRKTKLKK